VGFEANDEILQDFLVSSQEILENLDKQLVELEQRPDDTELLNSVFRGYHTIKGGAGFLALKPLVEVCHRAEDVFNLLRKGERTVTHELMDVVLRAFDVVKAMFDQLQGGQELTPAEVSLLAELEALAKPGAAPAAPMVNAPSPPPDSTPAPAGHEGDVTDAEFDQLLDAIQAGKEKASAPAAAPAKPAPAITEGNAEISDSEFEALLDQLHGPGKGPGASVAPPAAAPSAPPPSPPRAPAAATSEAETTVRVDTRRLDDMMNMVGELVLVRNRLVNLQGASTDERIAKAVADLSMVTSDLQAAVMKTRMQPIKKVYGRFPRVVRDLARQLKKEVSLEMYGEETEVDKNLVEMLYDPLVHLVRNAVDHGIESPEKRANAGKPRAGKVVLAAEQAGDHILLTITDDGAGMDPEVLRRKAVEKGLLDADAAARLTALECFNLIFLPGFTTKAQISDVSGRGVGMDVVRTKIGQINGVIEIDSSPGKGSRISIKVPLTLAIIPTLMVVVGEQTFALPLVGVGEILDLELRSVHVVDGQQVVVVRDRSLPIFYLKHWLIRNGTSSVLPAQGHVVVVYAGNQRVGLIVDRLIGQEEVVIKPLGAGLHGTPGVAGATITGDGRIALILDQAVLIRRYAQRHYQATPTGHSGDAREVA
jgi:two-component system chemotaxis sensor kinase CheA